MKLNNYNKQMIEMLFIRVLPLKKSGGGGGVGDGTGQENKRGGLKFGAI